MRGGGGVAGSEEGDNFGIKVMKKNNSEREHG